MTKGKAGLMVASGETVNPRKAYRNRRDFPGQKTHA
jgi:hypothetical protein